MSKVLTFVKLRLARDIFALAAKKGMPAQFMEDVVPAKGVNWPNDGIRILLLPSLSVGGMPGTTCMLPGDSPGSYSLGFYLYDEHDEGKEFYVAVMAPAVLPQKITSFHVVACMFGILGLGLFLFERLWGVPEDLSGQHGRHVQAVYDCRFCSARFDHLITKIDRGQETDGWTVFHQQFPGMVSVLVVPSMGVLLTDRNFYPDPHKRYFWGVPRRSIWPWTWVKN